MMLDFASLLLDFAKSSLFSLAFAFSFALVVPVQEMFDYF